MASKYTLKIKNDSQQSGSVCVYQTLTDQENNKNIYSLAWFSKECHSGTEVSFKWNTDYSFVWSETGQLIPGVKLKASQTKDANPSDSKNNLLYLSRESGAFFFHNDDGEEGQKGLLTIKVDDNVPTNKASIGVGMGGNPAIAMNVAANMTYHFTPNPNPTYWIAFGEFEEGSVIDVNNISQAKQIVFASNVYEQSLTFTEDNTWEVTGMNVKTGLGGDSCDESEKKSYEKSNHLCGYGCLTNPKPFDDFVHIGNLPFCKITKLSIWSGQILDGFEVTYSNGKTYKHGRTDGACQTLEFGEDSIIGIEGHYSVACTYPFNAISNMTIRTQLGKMFGPFGFAKNESGKFTIGKENCHIAILFGIAHTPKEWKVQVMNSIGGYYAKFLERLSFAGSKWTK